MTRAMYSMRNLAPMQATRFTGPDLTRTSATTYPGLNEQIYAARAGALGLMGPQSVLATRGGYGAEPAPRHGTARNRATLEALGLVRRQPKPMSLLERMGVAWSPEQDFERAAAMSPEERDAARSELIRAEVRFEFQGRPVLAERVRRALEQYNAWWARADEGRGRAGRR